MEMIMGMQDRFRHRFEALFDIADIRVGGDRPWDIHVSNSEFFARCFANPSLGLGESWMEGWWECERLDEMFLRAGRANLQKHMKISDAALLLLAKMFFRPSKDDSSQYGRDHYELGTELFRRMLGERMAYSCGYWKDASNLDEAQENKLDLIAAKLGFEPGQRVLDIGCGWGGMLRYFAEKYGINGVGVTISEDQYIQGNELCADLPVEIRLLDFKDLEDKFDRIYSVEMIGHLHPKKYRGFMEQIKRSLGPGGLFLLQTMGCDRSDIKTDPWIEKYIFPDSHLPTASRIAKASEGHLVLEDWHCFSQDYDRTFSAWNSNLIAARDEIGADQDQRVFRVWEYYLCACASGFRAGVNRLWQIVYSSADNPGHYYGPPTR